MSFKNLLIAGLAMWSAFLTLRTGLQWNLISRQNDLLRVHTEMHAKTISRLESLAEEVATLTVVTDITTGSVELHNKSLSAISDFIDALRKELHGTPHWPGKLQDL